MVSFENVSIPTSNSRRDVLRFTYRVTEIKDMALSSCQCLSMCYRAYRKASLPNNTLHFAWERVGYSEHYTPNQRILFRSDLRRNNLRFQVQVRIPTLRHLFLV